MDCICINQEDLKERSVQVKTMHELYRHANAVLIWLGEESVDSNLAMAYASTLDTSIYMQQAIDCTTHVSRYL